MKTPPNIFNEFMSDVHKIVREIDPDLVATFGQRAVVRYDGRGNPFVSLAVTVRKRLTDNERAEIALVPFKKPGTKFYFDGVTYVVDAFKYRNHKYPVIAYRESNHLRKYKFTVESVQSGYIKKE